MRELINTIPFWWLMIASIVLFASLSYFSSRLSTHLISISNDKKHRALVHTSINILSTGFFILIAFVIINTWNYLMEARNVTSKEADSLALLFHNISQFPEENRVNIFNAARNYLVSVRVNEWKAMRKGATNQSSWNNLETLYGELQHYKPQTPHETLFYSQAILNVNNIIEARRGRVNKLDSVIPRQISESLIVGTIFLTIFIGLIRARSDLISNIPIFLFAMCLAFNLALALSFDYPFSGSISVSNKLFYQGILGKIPD
ncbi:MULTISPECIES: DUF4239 domain-containing protein [Legionella]|uniref:DUF4239 domain-containing protein n=1 Tax=Legionella maceachernii TaxID=466 RepID=A0A0W0WHS8_9GAMM|nr:DUF4239 domain-containing protein [Legionella maceachernii]KTD31896.1 hypothetical protein Lmac_0086 [Legionella maceachernii]SJZ44778.1 Protein of unknown function [Legionella maceachernii]SUP04134.1 Uncharacterised protein [Legionella maceachernii]